MFERFLKDKTEDWSQIKLVCMKCSGQAGFILCTFYENLYLFVNISTIYIQVKKKKKPFSIHVGSSFSPYI